MSDLDDYFDDDIDAAAFDAVLSAATSVPPPTRQPVVVPTTRQPASITRQPASTTRQSGPKDRQPALNIRHPTPPPVNREPIAASSSTIDDCFDDDIDAAAFDAVVNAATSAQPTTRQALGGSGLTQKKYTQTTIFGASQVPAKPSRPSKQPTSSQYQPPVPKATQQEPKVKAVKKWDNLRAIKDVLPDINQKGKKRKKSKFADDDDEEEEMMDDEDVDSDTDLLTKALQETNHKKVPMKLQSDSEAIKTWIYSINKPKRKYQYDIVARALYNNCLVSLPTGLGKTFIAAVVMLNFYRWYPRGKVIFLAPTRPLVQQQIEACHSIAGIPSVDCVSLTGTTSATKRAVAWENKRVIFATPQTVANDLRRGSLRPEDIICLVVDEAHRATGAYAYCIVVKLLMRFNPHFRVLALTATPGSDPERVQAVIDNLHIGHIEVRTEESMDIVPYTKNKEIVLEKIPLTPELTSIRDKWGKLMLPLIKQCGGLFHGSKEPAYIHAFSITSAQMHIPKEKSYLRPNLAVLSKMATAMAKLLEYSITLAYEKMQELKEESGKCAAGVCSQVGYKSLMTEIRDLTQSPDFVPHPKMEKMKALTLEFFINAQDQGKSSRVMIFCHFRDMVTDIVNYLNQEKPIIKASAFVGQSNDVRGNRGMNQKTQNETIQRFKNNEFNVLVATSIGEEGLDIGALDFIICYEAQKSPLRMLQRLGRTGRNEDGKVIVLIAEGREDKNWEKAQDQYQHVQNALLSKKVLELYEDCERLVPEGVRPTAVDKEIDVQPYIADQVELAVSPSGRKKKDKPTKRKRPGAEDIPAGGIFGFVSAKDYAVPKSKADSLRQRTEAALLTAEEAAILKQQWSKNITVAPSPIDPENLKIEYFPTKSALGSRLESVPQNKRSARNITRSANYTRIMNQCDSYVHDDAKYEAWREDTIARLESKNVTWWPPELRGMGAQKPLRLCSDGPKSIRRRWTNSKDAGASTPVPQPRSPTIAAFSSPRSSSPRLLDEFGEGAPRAISPKGKSKKASQLDEPPSSHDDLPDFEDFIPSMKTSERLLPPPSIASPSPLASTSANAPPHARPDSTRAGQSSSFQRLAAFKSSVSEPAPFQEAVPSRQEFPNNAPVTPSGPSNDRGVTKKRLVGPARFQDDDDHSPLLFRALTHNNKQAPPISPSEYENGDDFLRPEILPNTQMPRSKRIQKSVGFGGKQKRIIAPESDDDDDDHKDDDGDVMVGEDGPDGPQSHKKSERKSDRHVKTRKEGASSSKDKGKQRQQKSSHSTRGNEWALKTGLFDLEASESDTSSSSEEEGEEGGSGDGQRKKKKRRKKGKGGRKKKKRSSSEEIESENSIDRDFLVNTSSSKIQDDCSPDKSMTSFYRASILMMSQPLSVVKTKLGKRAPSPQPRPNHHQLHHHHRSNAPRQSSSRRPISSEHDHPDDRFSFDSFCVPDEETIEYEDEDCHGIPSDL
ncbi:3'-5' DNA helicase [Puccinia graminis f. sp. tritici]|uniref:ATP-dependent DNA helicase n=2 Tax=Puccinia graminis f. sp. tritici TaxID=56615 RepID=A0A5B0PY42_PUCGR|nr:3'-5' DNA helicase [Puccinia graminis f. sp. tritici]KAA1135098.1 3'-5' DNA helicase [Puccinia graminis f. sp. tritici]